MVEDEAKYSLVLTPVSIKVEEICRSRGNPCCIEVKGLVTMSAQRVILC